jgi:hypothetical protein
MSFDQLSRPLRCRERRVMTSSRAWGNSFTMRSINPRSKSPGLLVAQLHAHEEQRAFDERGLASRSNMSDSFIGVMLSARIVGGRVAGRPHRPEINPRRWRSLRNATAQNVGNRPALSTMNAAFAVVMKMVRDTWASPNSSASVRRSQPAEFARKVTLV